MRIILLLLSFCLCTFISNATTYYVATNGNNSNPGTISAPFATISKLSIMVAGDIAYIRGGTYRTIAGAGSSEHFVVENLNGTSASMIKIWAYPGELPIFNLDNITTTYTDPTAFIFRNCNYIHLKGIRVTGLKQHTGGNGISRGFHMDNLTHCTIEFVEVDHIGGYGFYLRDGVNDNYFLNCDVHHLDDRYSNPGAWGNSNGFDCSNGVNATRNSFEGCRSWWCSDDGFDFYGTNGVQILKNCWSFWNGFEPGTFTPRGDGDGFKLGPDAGGMHNTLLRTLTNCSAFENKEHGFNQNVGDMKVKLYNNTTYKNGGYGYMWDFISPAPVQDFKNNVSYMDAHDRRGVETNGSNNSWNGIVSINSADFLSTSSVGADGPRGADGSLPVLNFLHLTTSSDLVNAGINVGLLFLGTAPDMGAYEYNGGIVNTPPTANAGADITITLPTSSVNLNGTGADAGGSITGYAWTKLSGPAGGTISSSATAATAITALSQGTYQFQLMVTDNNGATATDIIQIVVNAATVNTPPIANAGADKVITLPTNSVSVTGSGTDVGGAISSYLWTKVSGPAGGTISSTTAATTAITALVQGIYQFQLKITDNGGATATDIIQVTVNAATTTPALKVIRVNVYGSTLTYNNIKWNNWKPVAITSSSAFKYEDGTTSTVSGVLSTQNKIYDNGAGYQSTATICPAEVLRYSSTNHSSRTLTINGLNPAMLYSFEFFASSNTGSLSKTKFTVNSSPYTVATYNNKTNYGKFINVQPTSTGTLVVSVSTVAGYWNYLSAFTIIEQTATVSAVPVTQRIIEEEEQPVVLENSVAVTGLPITQRIMEGKEQPVAEENVVTVNAFPLPFSTSFTVSLQGGENGQYNLSLLDISGKLIRKKAVSKNTAAARESIYLGNFPNGVYLLEVISPGGNKITKQLIKN
ncbi:MAG: T9SS type A sorting domain-containing protein [Ferruginibacter sp.]